MYGCSLCKISFTKPWESFAMKERAEKGIPKDEIGFRDVLAFILAAFSHILPYTLIVIGVFAGLWLILKILF
jgi:hypothetical protein